MATPAQVRALTRTLATVALTRARIVGLAALGLLAVVVGFAIGAAGPAAPTEAGTDLVNAYGLSIVAPVVTLVVASATLGDCIEDNTLVYVWLRPISRALIAASAGTASFLTAAPTVVVPLAAAAALTGGGGDLVLATVAAGTLAVLGYLGLFVLLGLVSKRPLVWGVLYILIWEGFIARAGTASSQFSIQYYARSALAELSGVGLSLGDAPLAAAILAPLGALVLGLGLATVRLRHLSVA